MDIENFYFPEFETQGVTKNSYTRFLTFKPSIKLSKQEIKRIYSQKNEFMEKEHLHFIQKDLNFTQKERDYLVSSMLTNFKPSLFQQTFENNPEIIFYPDIIKLLFLSTSFPDDSISKFISRFDPGKTKGMGANGVVFTLNFKDGNGVFSVKKDLHFSSVNFFEYFIGSVIAGKMRLKGVPNFSLVFSEVECGGYPIQNIRKKTTDLTCLTDSNKTTVDIIETVEGYTLDRILLDLINSDVTKALYFFCDMTLQLLLALDSANEFKFCHNDMHHGNIIIRELKEKETFNYSTTNGSVSITTKRVPTLIDYGFSYCEYKGQKLYNEVDSNQEYSDFGKSGGFSSEYSPDSMIFKYLIYCYFDFFSKVKNMNKNEYRLFVNIFQSLFYPVFVKTNVKPSVDVLAFLYQENLDNRKEGPILIPRMKGGLGGLTILEYTKSVLEQFNIYGFNFPHISFNVDEPIVRENQGIFNFLTTEVFIPPDFSNVNFYSTLSGLYPILEREKIKIDFDLNEIEKNFSLMCENSAKVIFTLVNDSGDLVDFYKSFFDKRVSEKKFLESFELLSEFLSNLEWLMKTFFEIKNRRMYYNLIKTDLPFNAEERAFYTFVKTRLFIILELICSVYEHFSYDDAYINAKEVSRKYKNLIKSVKFFYELLR